MGKIYLEVTTSKYRKGTSMRDKSTEYVELEINYEIPSRFNSSEQIDEINSKITEVVEGYAKANDIVLGIEYENCMVGTNMYQDQKYSMRVFVDRGEGYFRNIPIKNIVYLDDPISYDWWCFHRDFYELRDGHFIVAKRS